MFDMLFSKHISVRMSIYLTINPSSQNKSYIEVKVKNEVSQGCIILYQLINLCTASECFTSRKKISCM